MFKLVYRPYSQNDEFYLFAFGMARTCHVLLTF